MNVILRMGCFCGKEAIHVNNRSFYTKSRLGEGGFSYVDLVEDVNSHKLYALKKITCHSKDDERIALEEVEVMKLFKHDNIVPLEEAAVVPINVYTKMRDVVSEVLIIMPFYRRGSIEDQMERLKKKNEHMSEIDLWKMFLQICEGLKAMHHHNPPYAHRDVKPANVMIGDDSTPILMDLGSAAKARVEIKTSAQGRALQDQAAERCSMLYRAPELFNVETHSTIDERTDIWSLGCVLYAMAYLESPFESVYQRGDSIALAVMGRNLKFKDIGYSHNVEETVCFLMAINPMERPFIDNAIDKVTDIINSMENRV
ncbi:hypothetical protein LOTGIDRAFT_223991 [Lottia gigantea]|uniref:non-specific serine/threonine protein kinase n=1 Tax=Lottia gigantea TaxID=225164 RepID=V4B1M3_LOTGI|nr:hypothetical protein LOTGIDRAFT_223991 [Lottia gigantea]ESP04238.1 hypothetical protein LOTGIDRAFT_223991 [Lottia gigantea]